jgi:hypothetical protein
MNRCDLTSTNLSIASGYKCFIKNPGQTSSLISFEVQLTRTVSNPQARSYGT